MSTGLSSTSRAFRPPDDQPAENRARDRGEAAEDEHRSALSAMSERENCTPSLAPHIMPATSATNPDTAHTISQI